jgi:hypothetical protein
VGLAVFAEDLTDCDPRSSLELVIEVEKRAAEFAGETSADRSFACARQPDQDNVRSLRRAWV